MLKKMFTRGGLLLFILLLIPSGLLQAAQTSDYILPNGMKVILIEDHRAPVVSMLVWVKVGSASEQPGEYGMSHLLEHMLFKGTGKRGPGEIAREVESSGGEINAYTSFDETVYYINMAARYADRGLDVLSDMVFNATLSADEFAREKEVVVEEIKRGRDNPDRRLAEAVFQDAFKVHPYGRPVIGFEDSVKNFTHDNFVRYYHRWYQPDNMVLVVSGDFSPKAFKDIIGKHFGAYPAGNVPAEKLPEEPAQEKMRLTLMRSDVTSARMVIAYHIPAFGAPDSRAVDLLSDILGGGLTSRLYTVVKREKQLVHGISSGSYTPKDPGLLMISADLDADKVTEALKAVMHEIARLRDEPAGPEDLARVKLNTQAYFIRNQVTMSGQARTAANFDVLAGDYRDKERYLADIESLTAGDLMEAARKYLTPDNLTVGVMLPQEAVPELTEEALQKAAAEGARPEKPTPKTAQTGMFTETRLSNGIRLLIKADHALPLVDLRAAFPGGVRYEAPADNGITNFMAAVWDQGTLKRPAEELNRDLENMAASLTSFSGRNSFGLEGEFLSRYLDRGLDLFTEMLTRPAFNPAEAEKQKPVILDAIRRQQDELAARTFKLFAATIYHGNPYEMTVLGTPENVQRFTAEDLKAWYVRWATPENMVLSIVGDVDPQAVIAKLEERLKDWQGASPPAPHIQPPDVWEGIRKAFDYVDRAQAHLVLGFPTGGLDSPDKYALEILNNVLSGQGGRLFVQLRDKESLAYTVTSFYSAGLDTGAFGLYIAFDPGKFDQARDGFFSMVNDVREKGITEDELKGAKENILGNYDINLQGYSAQASEAAFNVLYGLGLDYPETYVKKINSVSLEEVRQAARKYLNLDQAVQVVVGPIKG